MGFPGIGTPGAVGGPNEKSIGAGKSDGRCGVLFAVFRVVLGVVLGWRSGGQVSCFCAGAWGTAGAGGGSGGTVTSAGPGSESGGGGIGGGTTTGGTGLGGAGSGGGARAS